MSVVNGQPEIRFNRVGPMSLAGISYVPKTILIDKAISTAEGYDDVIALPAGTFITDVFAVMTDGCGNTTTEISLGTTTATEALIAATDFDAQTDHNSYHNSAGLYLGAGGTLRLTIGGTAAVGAARFAISYFELTGMAARGAHFSL